MKVIIVKLTSGDEIVGEQYTSPLGENQNFLEIKNPLQIRMLWPTPATPVVFITSFFYGDDNPEIIQINRSTIVAISYARKSMEDFYRFRLKHIQSRLTDFDEQVEYVIANTEDGYFGVSESGAENNLTEDDILNALGISSNDEDDDNEDDDEPPERKDRRRYN